MKSTMAFVCTVAGVGARIALRPTCGRGVSTVWCSPAQFCIIPLCRQPAEDDWGELEKRKGIGRMGKVHKGANRGFGRCQIQIG
jgi:hypothetical protein